MTGAPNGDFAAAIVGVVLAILALALHLFSGDLPSDVAALGAAVAFLLVGALQKRRRGSWTGVAFSALAASAFAAFAAFV
ncbi:hypothetical protein GBA65_22170 (plasmid) [Rubrobacter marinus]|uniref:Uncharacterized protein n=1 Tax=Rubrobacter marinus TaxID=2653852 RepID=A0A6G8Q3U4_9ACTN|nr:hypothetical protein [Rubrobacter marinus]QIN81142.1 hypothetical protein GBA65_22170 [Rubrobacter marinus]